MAECFRGIFNNSDGSKFRIAGVGVPIGDNHRVSAVATMADLTPGAASYIDFGEGTINGHKIPGEEVALGIIARLADDVSDRELSNRFRRIAGTAEAPQITDAGVLTREALAKFGETILLGFK